MKSKTAWIIALIAMPLLAVASVLHAQTNDREQEALLWASFLNDLQSRIDAAEFDLLFTITDTDGKPLDSVEVEISWSRPIPGLILSGRGETKSEEKTVDSQFRIQEKGWTGLELRFKKSGYYFETRRYMINFMPDFLPNNPDELYLDGISENVLRENIQIKMYKGVPAADLTWTSGYLIYDFEKATKTVCDLSAFDKKPEQPEKRTVSEEDEEDEEEYDEEDEEEYVEEIRIGMKKVDLKTKPELTRYIEVDFRRDDKGEVLFDGTLGDTPCPSSFIIRLHSDDPGDGFVAVDQLGSGFVRPEEYDKRYPAAPETGYQKELVFDFGKKGADGKYQYESNYLFAFVKCGEHYGKVYIHPPVLDARLKTIQRVRVPLEQLFFNRVEDDRNVSGGNFYVERELPVIKRIVPDKTEAKNEDKDVSDDKAELAKEQILLIHDALEQYKLDVGTYPSSLQGLEKNVDKSPLWDGPYIVPKVPRVDPLGNQYRYRFDAEKGTYRLHLISFSLSETATGERKDPPEPAQEQQTEPADQKKKDIYAGVPLWNLERDGKPETRLRDLVNDAAKRAEADLRPLNEVQFTPIDAEHSYADLDLDVVDEYGKVVRFIAEIEKKTPRLAWRRFEIRVEPAGDRNLAGDKQKTAASVAPSANVYRLTGQIRVVTYTPAAGPSASAKEKRTDDTPLAVGSTDFLSVLYDLSLLLPDDALTSRFQLQNDGAVNLSIQTHNLKADIPGHLRSSRWRLVRVLRNVADDISTFSMIIRLENPPPRQDSVSPEEKADTVMVWNIFDPRRIQNLNVNSGRPDVRPGANGARPENAASAAETKRQLGDAMGTRAELESMLQAFEQTPGVPKEQTGFLRQRIETLDRQIEHLREQLKALRP